MDEQIAVITGGGSGLGGALAAAVDGWGRLDCFIALRLTTRLLEKHIRPDT
ncbi:hypothetical protein [Actinomadura oligospora]|uniref:hypothetical protein n=1 Tax=Actinomadura oligospora TaxID=111804 RepID=UPI0004BCDF76|nr:hypothetical protein [Actinomadura oligospora]